MEDIHPYLRDGITTTITQIRCHNSGAPSGIKCHLQNCPGEPPIRRDKSWENSKFDVSDSLSESRRPITSTTWLCSSGKRMQDKHMAKTQQDKRTITRSQQIRQRQGQAFEGIWRIWLCSRPSHRLDVLFRVAQRSADSFVLVSKLGTKQFEDEQLEFQAFFMVWRFFKNFSELGPVSVAWRKTSRQPMGVWTEHPLKQHVQMRTAWSHFITRTRVAQELQCSGLHIFVSLKQLSSTCHVSFLAAPDNWPQAQVLSHPFHPVLTSFRRSLLYKHALWFSTHIYPAMFHDRVADQNKSRVSHMSPATVLRMNAVFSIVRKIYGREPADNMEDLDVNAAAWSILLNTTLQSSSWSWTRLWGKFTIRLESQLDIDNLTLLKWKENAGQTHGKDSTR